VLTEVLGLDLKTALTSAFQARREYDLEEEQRMIENLAQRKKLRNLEVSKITRDDYL